MLRRVLPSLGRQPNRALRLGLGSHGQNRIPIFDATSTNYTSENISTSTRLLSGANSQNNRNLCTNVPFTKSQLEILNSVAKQRNFSSPYWATWSQIRRLLNAEPKILEEPVTVYLGDGNLFPLEALEDLEQERILAACPPWFPTGTGIYRGSNRWSHIVAPRLEAVLNPENVVRKLYVDGTFVDTEKVQLKRKGKTRPDIVNPNLSWLDRQIQEGAPPPLDFRASFPLQLFNSDQLTVPARGFPLRGLALNINGRRIAQPAHDILLATGIMRGYASPFWLNKYDMKRAGVELDRERSLIVKADGKGSRRVSASVTCSTMAGLVVPLSCCHPELKTYLEMLPAAVGRLTEHDTEMQLEFGSATDNPLVHADPEFDHNTEGDVSPATTSSQRAKHEADLHSLRSPNLGPVQIFSCAGWERIRSQTLLNKFRTTEYSFASVDGDQPSSRSVFVSAHWVNVDEAIPMLPLHLKEELGITGRMQLSEARWKLLDPAFSAQCQAAFASRAEGNSRSVSSLPPLPFPIVDLADLTSTEFWNATCLTNPSFCNNSNRPLAIRTNGTRFGTVAESAFQKTSIRRGFSSPVWINKGAAKVFGVSILPSEVNHPTMVSGVLEAASMAERYVHISNFENPEEVIERFPIALSAHATELNWVLRHKWNAVGVPRLRGLFDTVFQSEHHANTSVDPPKPTQKQRKMKALLGAKLWVELDESILYGWNLKPEAKVLEVNRALGTVRLQPASSLNDDSNGSFIDVPEMMSAKEIDEAVIPAAVETKLKKKVPSKRPMAIPYLDARNNDDNSPVQPRRGERKRRNAPRASISKRKWYNAMQTTDPVRVIGLATYFYRPMS